MATPLMKERGCPISTISWLYSVRPPPIGLTESSKRQKCRATGTHGYLDPEYFHSNNLTQKSDVYGFGVVLLEMITGLPPIIRSSTNDEKRNLVDWARPIIATRDIQTVLDPRLEGDYDAYSLSKVAEIALACTSPRSIERPTMTDNVAGVFLVRLFFSICLSPDSLDQQYFGVVWIIWMGLGLLI
ncbi:putative LRR receptor-like serine/threonine-protein kinase [Cinnamomum micranthum f. kanehirae]|uniref:Putative LRR receptor-like serine/threonine-protein kinase n=1 Tax=Cinnamomum micranthum f. kanehirae TaxID=337451 RepID=A0A443NIJ3_9MAGN|nr:putative LRR receptor-like serine/threonine-protein kinase [Cinnamomum micranthum f. kanehirae]